MPFGQLNPLRTVAPESTVNTSALANILGQTNQSMRNIGDSLTNVGDVAESYGRDVNTQALNDLIASGQLEGKSEADIQKLIGTQAGGLRQSEEGMNVMKDLLGGARERAVAEQAKNDALEELGIKASIKQGELEQKNLFDTTLQDKADKSAMNRLLTKEEFDTSRQVGENIDKMDAEKRLFEQQNKLKDMEIKSKERIASAKIGGGKTGLGPSGVKKIMSMEDPIAQQTEMIETVLEDKNIFQDAKFDEPTELIVKGAVQQAMETDEGQSAFATGDKDVIIGVIKKNLPEGSFNSVASGWGALNPFGEHFLDTNKQVFVPKGK